jgi:hypothetical protein
MRNLKSSDSIKYGDMPASLFRQEPEQDPKYKLLLERSVERLFLRSERLGWNYFEFAARLTEVLIVLHHRNKSKLAKESVRE